MAFAAYMARRYHNVERKGAPRKEGRVLKEGRGCTMQQNIRVKLPLLHVLKAEVHGTAGTV